MPGRHHVRGFPCAVRFGRYCGREEQMGTRDAKRSEGRQVAAEIKDGVEEYQEEYRVGAYLVAYLREVFATLPPQENEGDLSWLVTEIEEWSGLRRAATTVLLGEDDDD